MSTVITYDGQQYTCEKAIKGSNYIHLLDANNNLIAAFDGIVDFSAFTLTSGAWLLAPSSETSPIATIGDDGKLSKGSFSCRDVGRAPNIVTFCIEDDRQLPFVPNVNGLDGGEPLNLTPTATVCEHAAASFYSIVPFPVEEVGGGMIKLLKPCKVLVSFKLYITGTASTVSTDISKQGALLSGFSDDYTDFNVHCVPFTVTRNAAFKTGTEESASTISTIGSAVLPPTLLSFSGPGRLYIQSMYNFTNESNMRLLGSSLAHPGSTLTLQIYEG